VRLAAPSLPRIWVMCVLTTSSATTSQAVPNAAQGLPLWFVEAHHHHVIITSEAGAWALPTLSACRWSRLCLVAGAGGGPG
jgi:hypothetical protein